MKKKPLCELNFAFVQTIPVLLGYLFLGLAFGLLLQRAGYGWPWALGISLFVYAGSMQFVLLGFLGTGMSLLSVALTTLSVNSRHLFYGLSFIEKFKAMGKALPYMIFSLTDETYSLLCALKLPPELDEKRVMVSIAALDHAYWVAGSLLGSLAGQLLFFDTTGIDFAMTALFVVIFVEQWLAAASKLPALIGLGSGALFLLLLGPEGFLLPALATAVVLLLLVQGPISAKTAAQKEALHD